MPRNGSGTFTLAQSSFQPNTTISSSAVNSDLSDIAAQITNSLAADGQTTMTGPIKASAGTAGSPSYTFAADPNTGFYSAAADAVGVAVGGVSIGSFKSTGLCTTGGAPIMVPIGSIVDFAGGSGDLPVGWFLCAGGGLGTVAYAALFAVIGYTYGGSGLTFKVPLITGTTFNRIIYAGTP